MADLILNLVPNDPRNTELLSPQGYIAYRCVTEFGAETYSRVFDPYDQQLANLQWNIGYPDKVQFREDRQVSIVQWMKKSSVPFSGYLSFMDHQGRKYRWKGLALSHCLKLYSEDDHYRTAIARFEEEPSPSVSEQEAGNQTEGRLILTPRATEIRDLVVVSYLFLETQKRVPRRNGGFGFSGWAAFGSSMAITQFAAMMAPSS